mgnify:CR=1 FL=1
MIVLSDTSCFFNNFIIISIGIYLDCKVKAIYTSLTNFVAFAVFADVTAPENTECLINTDEDGEVIEVEVVLRLLELHDLTFIM